MKQLAIIFLLAFAVSGCTSSRSADLAVPQSKVIKIKPVAKAGATPVSDWVKPPTKE